jgi:hypothetical protein
MRGFKVDERASKLLFKNGLFQDRRSRLVYDLEMTPHLLLKGLDMSHQRERVWKRDRERCRVKGANCVGVAQELDHKQGGLAGRCDCEHNLQAVCFPDHSQKHNRFPKWTPKKAQAHADFQELYKEST